MLDLNKHRVLIDQNERRKLIVRVESGCSRRVKLKLASYLKTNEVARVNEGTSLSQERYSHVKINSMASATELFMCRVRQFVELLCCSYDRQQIAGSGSAMKGYIW